MTNTNSNKQKGMVFYMKEKHYLRTLDSDMITNIVGHAKRTEAGNIDSLIFKKIVETIQSFEIDLKDKFTYWGIVINNQKADLLRLRNDVKIVFFTTNKIHSCVFPENHDKPNLEKLENEYFFKGFIKTIEQLTTTYDPIHKFSLQK